MRRGRWNAGIWSRGKIAAASAAAGAALLLACGELQAQAPRSAPMRTVRGVVESMTTAPRGEIDGAVMEDGTVIHWPPHLADRFAAAVRRGDRIEAEGRTETGRRGETRFEVRTVTNLDTDATAENDGRDGPRGKKEGKKGRKSPPPPPRRDGPPRTVQGTVERMTTAPKGEIDGAVLDDGTVLHWPPHLEDRFADIVARGDRIKATGFEETGRKGEERFEVEMVTNLRTDKSAENDGGPRGARPEPRRGEREGNAGRSERIRELKEQAERLQREIERLERDLEQ